MCRVDRSLCAGSVQKSFIFVSLFNFRNTFNRFTSPLSSMFSVMGNNATKGIAVVVAGLVLTVGLNSTLLIHAETELIKEDEITTGKIEFTRKTNLNDVLSEIQKIKETVDISSITSEFVINGVVLTDFILGNANIDDVKFENELKNKRREFVKKLSKKEHDENAPKVEKEINFTNFDQEINDQSIIVKDLTILGQKSKLDKIQINKNIVSISIQKSKQKSKSKFLSKVKSLVSPVKASAAFENYLPNYGETYIGQGGWAGEDYNSTRFNFNYMYWNNNNFAWGDTYEHEFYLWNGTNINRKTYLTKGTNWSPNCEPNDWKYAASNLPSPYIDTRLNGDGSCDSWGDEVSYTIGTSWSKDILKQTWYYTYSSTPKGDRDLPVFKVSGQVGYNHWLPGVPTGTWSSFQYNGGTTSLIVQPNGNYITNPTFDYPANYYKATFSR